MAAKLRISENDPILKRKRFVYDDKGVPVEYNIGYYNANSFTYTITAER
jgi:GntR family transcriptional regulator